MSYAKHLARAAAGALLLAGLSQAAFAAPPGPPPQGIPVPRILVVDRNEVLRRSAAGQSMMRQVQSLLGNAESGLKARENGLRQEGQALQQQLAILSASVKAAKIKAFEVKQQAFQRDVQVQQNLIQGGVAAAREQVMRALGPILKQIAQERGANMLLDRQLVMVSANGFDVTDLAIQRLNQALPTVVVKPTPMPTGPGQQQ